MDALDRALLNHVQSTFPVAARPYPTLGKLTNTNEKIAWQKIQELRQQGIIRRLGGVFDSHRLGYKSTLCAAKVPKDKIWLVANLLHGLTGVTHNYLRDHEYNMWFTMIAATHSEVDTTLEKVKALLGSEEVYSLPAQRLFKISVDFNFGKENPEEKENPFAQADQLNQAPASGSWEPDGSKPMPYPIVEEDKALIRLLQGNLPKSLTPFKEIAQQLNCDEDHVISRTQKLIADRIIRRFGAVLRHQKAGFTANAMGVWQVPDDQAEEKGRLMAEFREVSHCYQRPSFPGWPYNLFTMIHGHSVDECQEVMERISQVTGVKDFRMLFSQEELKKSSMQYFMEEND